jgi:hypothetical protein
VADWLQLPYVQSGAAPFAAALLVAALFGPLRLGGLAAGAGFAAAVWLIGSFGLTPLSASRKLVVVVLAATLAGAALDVLRVAPRPALRAAVAAVCAAGAVWMIWAVLVQQPVPRALVMGLGAAALPAWLAASGLPLASDPLRAGAAGLAGTLGAGLCALLGGSALLSQYGIALAAGCGAFLLVAVLRGGRATPCAALVLGALVGAGLVGVGAATLARLDWIAVALLALVTPATRLPLPRAHAWWRAAVAAFYSCAVAGAAIARAWWVASEG